MFEYQYDIKLEYDPGKSDPSKIFMAYSDAIRSFKRIDNLLVKTINHVNTYKQTLENVQTGSIISTIKSLFEFSEEELPGIPVCQANDIQKYLTNSTSVILESVSNQKIESIKQLEDIRNKITNVAKEEKIGDSFSFSEPNTSDILEVIKELSGTTEKLSETESLTYQVEDFHVKVPQKIEVKVQRIEEDMKETILTSNRRLILKIKTIHLLGNAKWEFKHGKQTIEARIFDQKWFADFHNKKIPLLPGDSLDVSVNISEEYDKYGKLINANYNIEEVFSIKHGEIDEE